MDRITHLFNKKNPNIKVHFEIIAFLGDQPKRKLMDHLMLGNSKFGAGNPYSVDVGSIVENVTMCMPCLGKEKSEKYIFFAEK